MVQHLKFNPIFRPAILQVFGKTLICRDMDSASQFARSSDMDCITLEGQSAEGGVQLKPSLFKLMILSSCSCERSALRRLSNYLGATQTAERLSALALIHVNYI